MELLSLRTKNPQSSFVPSDSPETPVKIPIPTPALLTLKMAAEAAILFSMYSFRLHRFYQRNGRHPDENQILWKRELLRPTAVRLAPKTT